MKKYLRIDPHLKGIYLAVSALISVLTAKKADAMGLFPEGKCVFDKVVNNVSPGSSNQTLVDFPSTLFMLLNLLVFLVFAGSIVQVGNAMRQGEEVAQLMRTPLIIMGSVFIILVIQKVLLSGVEGC